MKSYLMIKENRSIILIMFCLLNYSCVVSITQESAQRAVDDARVAIETAKGANASTYSADNFKKAERMLTEAEDALLRNRRQRAYTLATKAAEIARMAEEEAKQNLEAAYPTAEKKADDMVTPPDKAQTDILTPEPAEKPASSTLPSSDVITTLQQKAEFAPSAVSATYEGMSSSDVQNRIKAAIQALEEAQKAVLAARLLMFRTQVEIGLFMEGDTVQKAKQNGVPAEVVNLIQSWYDQARKAAAAGKYEDAIPLLERAQTYAQAFGAPVKPEK